MAVSSQTYDVFTNLDPKDLNAVGLEVFRKWTIFALGAMRLGGKMLMHPTGKYASSISFRRYGSSRVAIIANEKAAPEAGILETGHGPIDMFQHYTPGKVYPMGRSAGANMHIGSRQGPQIWAGLRHAAYAGAARIPLQRKPGEMNTSGTGPAWTIPAMPAYSPARILAELVTLKYGRSMTSASAVP